MSAAYNTPTSSRQEAALGVDVGGTKIAAGLVPFQSGQVVGKRIVPTRPERGGEAVLADVAELIRSYLQEAEARNLKIVGAGVAVAELVDPQGNVTSAQTIAWQGLPVRDQLSNILPTEMESDVRVAAVAEAQWGAGKGFRLVGYVAVGTGISYTLVQEGRPYAGARGNALVLGSGPLTVLCPDCGSQVSQVLEEFASGPALLRRYNARSSGKVATAEEVISASADADPLAAEIVRSAGEALGNSVGFLINLLDPEILVVGGGLGLAGGLYWSSFVDAARRHIWSETTRRLPIVPAALGEDAGIIGAAQAFWDRWETRPRGTTKAGRA